MIYRAEVKLPFSSIVWLIELTLHYLVGDRRNSGLLSCHSLQWGMGLNELCVRDFLVIEYHTPGTSFQDPH
jgi:hypothetical protein